MHRPYCSFVRWDGELCRQHWTTTVPLCRLMKSAYGPPRTNPTKRCPQNGLCWLMKLCNFNKTLVSSQIQNYNYNVQYFSTRRKINHQARPTKMALSKRKRNYVIRMDGFIFWRLMRLDCVVAKASNLIIRTHVFVKTSLRCQYIFGFFYRMQYHLMN